MSRSRVFRSRGFERLERRLLLAGNLVATYSAGELRIDGSAAGDQAALVASPTDNRVVVMGQNGTTVNGSDTVEFNAVNDITIDLGGGDNRISLQSSTPRPAAFETLNLRTGNGDDVVFIDRLNVEQSTRINTLGGDDLVIITGAWMSDLKVMTSTGDDAIQLLDNRLSGTSSVATVAGNDAIDIRGNVFLNTPVADRFYVLAGGDVDHVSFVSNTIRNGSNVVVHGGAGNDVGQILGVLPTGFEGGSLNDANTVLRYLERHPGWRSFRELKDAVTHDVRVSIVDGVATIDGTHFDDDIYVGTRLRSLGRQEWRIVGRWGTTINGQDSIVLDDVRAFEINLHGGDDVFQMSDLFRGLGVQRTRYDAVTVDLGNGDDLFRMFFPIVNGVFSLHGGDGRDYINVNYVNASRIVVDAGSGDDTLDIYQSSVGVLLVDGKEGNDIFRINHNAFTSSTVRLYGNVGDDTVIWNQNKVLDQSKIIAVGGDGNDIIYYDSFDRKVFETEEVAPFTWQDGIYPPELHVLYRVVYLYGNFGVDPAIYGIY